ncbi:hypothetical protein H7U19_03810 [Hyunsoonleella sp. SJ7]|uniref:Phage abortive infection protein n=1 Tax=Hyunsoonleella aquatilis TaxID=2762758 RepID=A0A923HCF2_9FLAO|nr:hypothetical protein [Hyunsoonleella aquatilis]MBC3757513.1 hypothetical protein [Hyunsoonleella aquatilis]
MNKSYKLLIIGLLLLVIVSPALLTQISGIISFNSESGAIGDTIGGITAPIVNILGAVLIFISFQEQVKANTQQIENQNIDRFRNDYEEIKKEFYQVGFNEKEIHQNLNKTVFESPIDIYSRDLEIRKEGNITFEYQFKYVLYLIQYFIEELEKSNLTDSNKKLFVKKIYQFYYSRIEYHIDESIGFAEEYKYDVPFIILAKKVSKLIKDKRIEYGIKDSGTL